MEDNREAENQDHPISPARCVDQVCDRFELAWKCGERPAIEKYLDELDKSIRPDLLRELIRLELELRRKCGEIPSLAEYRERFAGHSEIFAPLFPEAVQSETDVRVPPLRTGADETRSTRLHLSGEIGRGGMGAVLKGHDIDLRRDVAVKVLREEHRDRPQMVRRFIEEAQICGQLQHPGIVPIYEMGRLDDGRPYFSMKIIKGRNLSELLRERSGPPEDLPRFLDIYKDICEAIAYAHTRRVIHRDLKPHNVMVGAFNEVQVVDWGLAKKVLQDDNSEPEASEPEAPQTVITTDRGQSVTPSVKGGTPSYMAPEQAAGEEVDERCDVFALGSILCEILTGQPAYTGSSSPEILRKAMRGDLADAYSRLNDCGVDPELVGLARDSLAPERDERPRDANIIESRITIYLRGVQERLRTAELARVEAETRAAEEIKQRELADRLVLEVRQKSRTRLALAASVLVTMVVVGGGWYWIGRGALARRRAVGAAMAEARLLQERARNAPLEDLSGWTEALAKAKQAEGQLAGANEPALIRQVIALRDQIEAERRAAQDERKLLTDLETIRGKRGEHGEAKHIDDDYAAAFRDMGLDLDQLGPEEAGAKIAARRSAMALASFVDDWTFARRQGRGERDGLSWRRLLAVARAADPDPWHATTCGPRPNAITSQPC